MVSSAFARAIHTFIAPCTEIRLPVLLDLSETWEECYDALIGGLQAGLKKQGGYDSFCEKIQKVRQTWVIASTFKLCRIHTDYSVHTSLSVIPYLLGPLKCDPVLLHGDLWVSP